MAKHVHIQRAIDELGSQPKLAREAGLSQQHISKLLNFQRSVSADIALAIERATKGRVRRWELRPDYWTAPTETQVGAQQ